MPCFILRRAPEKPRARKRRSPGVARPRGDGVAIARSFDSVDTRPPAPPSCLSRLFLAALVALSALGCSWDCGTVRRTVADGSIRDAAGVILATARADLSEHLGPSFLRLSVGVMGPAASRGAPLRGHVTRARLIDERGELIAEIPTSTTTLYIDHVVALNTDLASRAEYDRVRNALLTGRTKVILDSDLPGRERTEATLSNARDEPEQVGRCSPM